MLNMKFGSNYNKFQKGSILTIVSLVSLHKYLERKFGLKYLMTSHIDQDYVESFIGSMRLSDGRGGVRKPTYLQLNYRIQRKILASFKFNQFMYIKNISTLNDYVFLKNLKCQQKFDNLPKNKHISRVQVIR